MLEVVVVLVVGYVERLLRDEGRDVLVSLVAFGGLGFFGVGGWHGRWFLCAGALWWNGGFGDGRIVREEGVDYCLRGGMEIVENERVGRRRSWCVVAWRHGLRLDEVELLVLILHRHRSLMF